MLMPPTPFHTHTHPSPRKLFVACNIAMRMGGQTTERLGFGETYFKVTKHICPISWEICICLSSMASSKMELLEVQSALGLRQRALHKFSIMRDLDPSGIAK